MNKKTQQNDNRPATDTSKSVTGARVMHKPGTQKQKESTPPKPNSGKGSKSGVAQ